MSRETHNDTDPFHALYSTQDENKTSPAARRSAFRQDSHGTFYDQQVYATRGTSTTAGPPI